MSGSREKPALVPVIGVFHLPVRYVLFAFTVFLFLILYYFSFPYSLFFDHDLFPVQFLGNCVLYYQASIDGIFRELATKYYISLKYIDLCTGLLTFILNFMSDGF